MKITENIEKEKKTKYKIFNRIKIRSWYDFSIFLGV